MLVMFMAWLVACAVVGFRRREKEAVDRGMVFLAALVMTVTYLIPHSMGGSELDYSKLDEVSDPKEAIRTGR